MRLSRARSRSSQMALPEPLLLFLQVGPLKPPGGWVKSLQNLALKTAAPSRVDFRKLQGAGVCCSCSDAIRKADIRVGTGGEALKYGHFRQFLCACSSKMKPEQAQKNFLGNGKNLNEFQVYFEILKQLGLQFDAIRKRKEGRYLVGRGHQRR